MRKKQATYIIWLSLSCIGETISTSSTDSVLSFIDSISTYSNVCPSCDSLTKRYFTDEKNRQIYFEYILKLTSSQLV